jgi:hypothetical protein
MVLRTLGRMIVVSFAGLLAILAALAVLLTLGAERLTQAMTGRELIGGNLDTMLASLQAAARLLAAATILPGLALVVIGEVARIRSLLYYVVGGGAAMAAIPLIARLGQAGGALPAPIVWQVFATAGFAGGLVYWLVAGRRA